MRGSLGDVEFCMMASNVALSSESDGTPGGNFLLCNSYNSLRAAGTRVRGQSWAMKLCKIAARV